MASSLDSIFSSQLLMLSRSTGSSIVAADIRFAPRFLDTLCAIFFPLITSVSTSSDTSFHFLPSICDDQSISVITSFTFSLLRPSVILVFVRLEVLSPIAKSDNRLEGIIHKTTADQQLTPNQAKKSFFFSPNPQSFISETIILATSTTSSSPTSAKFSQIQL